MRSLLACLLSLSLLTGTGYAWIPNPVLLSMRGAPSSEGDRGEKEELQGVLGGRIGGIVFSTLAVAVGLYILASSLEEPTVETRTLKEEIEWDGGEMKVYSVKKRPSAGIRIGMAFTGAGLYGLYHFIGERTGEGGEKD